MRLMMAARVTFPEIIGKNGGALVIKKIVEVHIESSWKEQTSHAQITLPRNVKDFDKRKVKEIFKTDSPVIIELGYNETLYEEFTGYITSVSADIPIVIKCEDEMRKLKKIPVNYSNPNVTLEKMLQDIAPGYSVDALENVKLGSVRFSQTTVAKVLKKLESDWHLHSYMKGKQLVCGKYYSDDTGEPVLLHMEKNLVGNDLNYRSKEEVVLKITANSILVNGTKIKYEIGEEGGDQLNLTYYNIETKAELEVKAKADYEKAKKDKYEGGVTAYGRPSLKHGMKVNLISELYEDRNGVYYIDGVTKTMNDKGYRQQVKLGDKV